MHNLSRTKFGSFFFKIGFLNSVLISSFIFLLLTYLSLRKSFSTIISFHLFIFMLPSYSISNPFVNIKRVILLSYFCFIFIIILQIIHHHLEAHHSKILQMTSNCVFQMNVSNVQCLCKFYPNYPKVFYNSDLESMTLLHKHLLILIGYGFSYFFPSLVNKNC